MQASYCKAPPPASPGFDRLLVIFSAVVLVGTTIVGWIFNALG
jgi:hypothetical protein